MPHVDLWDLKPPGTYAVYGMAIAALGETTQAIRWIDLLLFPMIAFPLYWMGQRLHHPYTGLVAVAGFGLFYFTESFWTLSQSDGIVLLPMSLAAAFALKTQDNTHTPHWSFLCGAAAGITIWFKYPFALFAVGLVIDHLMTHRGKGRQLVYDGLAFAGGSAIVLLGGLLYLHQHGAAAALVESAIETSEYAQQGYGSGFDTVIWRQALRDRWLHWGLLAVLVVNPALLRMLACAPLRLVGIWFTSALGILLVQAKGYDYHWLPLLPPALLLAAYNITKLVEQAGQPRFQRLLVGGVIAVLLCGQLIHIGKSTIPYLSGQQSLLEYYDTFRGGEYVAGESQRVAAYLKERTTPGEALFIYGFRPEIYYLTGLQPATRFISQFPLVASWYPAGWKQENVDRLWGVLPPYVLVLRGDYMPWMTGRDADSNSLLQEDVELNNWLIYNYEKDTEIGSFLIWKRKTTPGI